MKQLLKGGRVLDPSQNLDTVCDVLIDGDQIAAIGANLSVEADEVHQLTPAHWVTPGLIDMHVHLREPGHTDKETLQSGTEAAITGGFTAVACMPNTQPTIDNVGTLEYVQQRARQTARIPVYVVAATTINIAGEQLTEIGALKASGAVGFTDDGHCIMNTRLMRNALAYCAMLDVPFICHAEDTALSHGFCMHEGEMSVRLGLTGYPSAAESIIVARDIQLAELTGAHVHFAHISTAHSVELIHQAKAKGLRITAETAPHYLMLTDEALKDYNANFKMNPPLREIKDQEALKAGLADGTIDAIATDHAPHTPDEKSQALDCCPNGVIGLETSLSVCIESLIRSNILSPLALIDRMSTAPARILKLPGGSLREGSVADITVIDPEFAWTVNPNQLKSQSRNTPFAGQTLHGKAIKVFSRGQELLLPSHQTLAVV